MIAEEAHVSSKLLGGRQWFQSSTAVSRAPLKPSETIVDCPGIQAEVVGTLHLDAEVLGRKVIPVALAPMIFDSRILGQKDPEADGTS